MPERAAWFDLHVHSTHSPDSVAPVKELLAQARKLGLTGLAITDHNSLAGAEEALRQRPEGLVVIPGMEVTTAQGHVLALGVREAIPRDLSAAETVSKVAAAGGVAVAAHPFRVRTGLGREAVVGARFAAIETLNSRTRAGANKEAQALAHELGIGATGGSDSHTVGELGRAYAIADRPIGTAEELLEELRAGRTRAGGSGRAVGTVARRTVENAVRWARRGGRPM